MHVEGWHVWVGGLGALGVVTGTLRWLFSQFNGKADKAKVEEMSKALTGKTDRATTKILFEKIEKHSEDISALKENTAVTRTKVESIEGGVRRIEDKLSQALSR